MNHPLRSNGFRSALLLLPLVACTYDEGIIVQDMVGTIVVPEAAATRTFAYEDGTEQTVTDTRVIGPIYLGLYASVDSNVLSYPHPEMGPIIDPDVPGDTYPYGGTAVGDVRFACVEFLTCKTVSGRFLDYDAIVDWFRDVVKDPVTDSSGVEVPSGDWLKQECYDLLFVTQDAEVRITAYEDRNDDGVIDEKDLDFVQRSDGAFEAPFTIFQQDFVEGFSLWGWMDSPSPADQSFRTCDPTEGFNVAEYDADFNGGTLYDNLLNFPSNYIERGDYVASTGFTYQSADETPELLIDFLVE